MDDFHHLRRPIALSTRAAHDLCTPLLEADVFCLRLLLERNALEARREDVEGEKTSGEKVSFHARQARQLVLHGIGSKATRAADLGANDSAEPS